ncbi:MAG: HTH domain-containing protein [Candidatus Staskawiczbacteria bacterium]|nr:HTH domain-containing protein [Candidatus Staskawiczbacteria bacterium]
MSKINYQQLYKSLTKGLSPKTKDIFDRRFGVKTGQQETLESIGKSMGITRERVRQIEEAGFTFVKKQNKEVLDKTLKDFVSYFEDKGGFKKEDVAIGEIGGENAKPYILFLLTLGEQFSRVCEKKDFYSFWSTIQKPEIKIKETLGTLVKDIQKQGTPLQRKEFFASFASKNKLNDEELLSYLEISKRIQENKEGKIGLIDWPEIKPRGVRDKAFLVFKKHQKPLHFTRVAEMIDELEYNLPNKKTYPQTVHNELIKDARFVLVGRGTYALQEWGYSPGTIRDVITKVLGERNEALHKDDVVKEVLSQRLVAKNTVLMNLNNKKYFQKNEEGKYSLVKIQTS